MIELVSITEEFRNDVLVFVGNDSNGKAKDIVAFGNDFIATIYYECID